MNSVLPDVALSESRTTLLPLDWVGMRDIDVPIRLAETATDWPLHARADLQVDLPDPGIKGIHMSRLYRLLDSLAAPQTLSTDAIAGLLEAMVASHADCRSTRARLKMRFSLLQRRSALVTEGLSGWKAYPVTLEAQWHAGRLVLDASVDVTYSSTCPCSAALSRQLLSHAFVAQFEGQTAVEPAAVADWLAEHGSIATPHSQRSVATVKVRIPAQQGVLGLASMIDSVESALGTPVQTAVKRADEQAFARLNGANLMYVEDAARRVQQALEQRYAAASVSVRHLESLHPHDAVASASSYPPPSCL
jgi:GTP cyclohydrolase I